MLVFKIFFTLLKYAVLLIVTRLLGLKWGDFKFSFFLLNRHSTFIFNDKNMNLSEISGSLRWLFIASLHFILTVKLKLLCHAAAEGIKRIVYQPKIFGIRSLFVSFHLVWHRIVDTEKNTAITYRSIILLGRFPTQLSSTPGMCPPSQPKWTARPYINMFRWSVIVCMRVCANVCMRMCICECVCECVYANVCMRMCICECVYANVCMRMCVCECVYANVYMPMSTCKYMYANARMRMCVCVCVECVCECRYVCVCQCVCVCVLSVAKYQHSVPFTLAIVLYTYVYKDLYEC
jgi:hypothetical protein